MLKKINKFKPILLTFVFTLVIAFSTLLLPAHATCPENVVPNPLDPNCELPAGQTISVGFLINRFIVFLPYIVTLIGVACYAWGAIKIIMAQDSDQKNDGVKILLYVTGGLGAFFSLWLLLFLVSLVTGFDLLKAIGQ